MFEFKKYDVNSDENKKLKERNPDSLRKLGQLGDLGFTSEELLSGIDFNSLERLIGLAKYGNFEEVTDAVKDFDFTTLSYIRKLATKRVLASTIYKMCIGNLISDSEEFKENMSLVGIDFDAKPKKIKKIKLVPNN